MSTTEDNGSDVRYWHKADNSTAPVFVRFWTDNSGQSRVLVGNRLSAYDISDIGQTVFTEEFMTSHPKQAWQSGSAPQQDARRDANALGQGGA